MSQPSPKKTHRGSCTCGLVRYEADVDPTEATMCNCSICQKLGARGVMLKPEDLRILSDESQHATVANSIGARWFCPRCHVYCYSRGVLEQLGGAFASININTLDDFDPSEAKVTHWDGRHDAWQAGARATPWPVFRR